MPKSVYQSVKLVSNGMTVLLEGIELCPVLPDGVKSKRLDDGSIIEIGLITKRILPNGDIKIYMPKPSYQDCFNSFATGAYYEFRGDGQVVARVGNEEYYWSAPVDIGDDQEEIYIPCRDCGSNCEGMDWEKHSFCSRSCMVDYSRDY